MQSPKPTLKQRADQLGISDEDFEVFLRVLSRLGTSYGAEGGVATALVMSPDQRTDRSKKGAKARNANLSPEQRSKIAQKAAAKRWSKVK